MGIKPARPSPKVVTVMLLVSLLALAGVRAQAPATTPPAVVQGQSFSIDAAGPSAATGLHPADILGIGGLLLIACEDLGLVCLDPATGAVDNITGMSFGADFMASERPPWQFSVAAGSQGIAGAVREEANCSPPEPQADVFESGLDGANLQVLDGDGVPCSDNTGFGLSLIEGVNSDNLNALAPDPCQYVDLNCDGLPDQSIFLTLGPGSPTLTLVGATAADVLMTGVDYVPVIWARGEADLGLVAGDVINGLCIQESGSGRFGSEDLVLFSLAPGSPTLAKLAASAGDLLRPAPPRVAIPGRALGLTAGDDVNALLCSAEIVEIPVSRDIFLPRIQTE